MESFGRFAAGRAKWIVVFASLLALSATVPVLAESSSEPSSELVEVPAEPASFPPPDSEDIAARVEQAERKEEERARELESPAAVAEREASRFAYKSIESSGEAGVLLRSAFEEELAAIDLDPARILTDSALRQSLGQEGAIVVNEGEPELIEADIPAKVVNDEGQLSKVDLDLKATSEGLEPENPIVDIVIGPSPAEGVELANGETAITPSSADPESVGQPFGDKDALYPEVHPDTDLLVTPLSSGVELFDILRSPESPEEFRFELDIPAGAELQANPAGGAEVREGEKLVGMISPPTAVDAQGTRIPVEMTVEGSSIELTLEHRDEDYMYPLLLDPEYLVQNDWVNVAWIFGNAYHVLEDGTFQTNRNNPNIYTNRWCIYACWGSGRGLFISFPGINFGAQQWAHWSFRPPGETSFMTGYQIKPFYRYDYISSCWSDKHPNPHNYDGLWDPYPPYYGWTAFYTNRSLATNAVLYNSYGREFVFGMTSGSGSSNPCNRDLYAGGIALYMSDGEFPTLGTVTGFPTGWQGPGNFSVQIYAIDQGLGLKSVTAFPQGANPVQLKPDCFGNHDSPCPREVSGPKTLSGTQFLEGERTVQFSALDALGRGSTTQTNTARIDRTPPKIELAGQLAFVTDEEGTDEEDGKKWEPLNLPVYNLAIEATDGSLTDPQGNADGKYKRSGVKDIEIFLDAKTTEEKPLTAQSCPNSSCKMTQTYQLKMSGLTAGKHTLRVISKDQLNQAFERSIEFEYAPATGMKDEYVMHYFPLPDGTGDEDEEEHPVRPELAVNVVNGNLVYRERDLDVEGPAVDLEVERYYNSMLPEAENTEWGDGWTLGQTPKLEPAEGAGTPEKGDLLARSGVLKKDIVLPTQAGTSQFNADLQTRVTKLSGGGYELTDESGESTTSTVLDPNGKTTELRAGEYAKVDYEYEVGELAQIEVEDPGSVTDFAQVEKEEVEYISPSPVYQSSFGTTGTGNGQLKSSGDVAVAANGDLWVVDRANNRIQRFNSSGQYVSQFGSLGSGNGQFNRPTSIAIDTLGNLRVADANNNRIQKFDASGTFVKAIGSYGTGLGKFSQPEGIAADAKGNIWVADTLNRRVQKLTAGGIFLLQFGSQGSGNGQFGEANSIDIGPGGRVWVADRVNNRISQFTEAGAYVQKFGAAGSGDGQFNQPYVVEVDSRGNVWVGDQGNHRIQQFTEAGAYVGQFGTAGSGNGQFSLAYPMGIAVDNKGGIWVTDVSNHRIQKWVLPAYRPKFNAAYGSYGSGDGQFGWAADVAVDSEGHIWVADNFKHRVQQFKPNGEFISKFGTNGTGAGQLNWPAAIAIDADDNIWVADAVNRIQKFSSSGQYLGKIGSAGSGNGQFATWGPEGMAIDPQDNIWVSDTAAGRVQKFSSSGAFIKVIGSPGSGAGQFGRPTDIDFDAQGNAWITDRQHNRVSIFNNEGNFIRQFGTTGTGEDQFKGPEALEIDDNGTVWVADYENHRVQAFNEANEYLTQFGVNGSGDSQLNLGHIMGIESDDYGRIWITDTYNNKLKKWKIPNWVSPIEEKNDPSVAVETGMGLVKSVEGEEAGEHSYQHEGDLLTAYEGPEGETSYEYDSADRMTKVELPNGTWASIAYYEATGRVKSVTVAPEGANAKMTHFAYVDAPLSTVVTPPDSSVTTYLIGEDGSVLKWWNTPKAPEIFDLAGTLYAGKETQSPIVTGDHTLLAQAHSEEGIASIQFIANGSTLVDEITCEQDLEKPGTECKDLLNQWVTNTGNLASGILNLEVLVTDRIGSTESKRFWVNIPYTPPPPDGAAVAPTFQEILNFREEHGLEVTFPVQTELELHERIFDLIGAWYNPNTPAGEVARASIDRWGVPLRPVDIAELEYRIAYQAQAEDIISSWAQNNAGATYAGHYIDERAGGLIRVGFIGNQDTQITSLKNTDELLAPERVTEFPSPPVHSLVDLETRESQIQSIASTTPAITRIGVDIKQNTILVGASNVSQVSTSLANSLGAQAPFTVVYEPEPIDQASAGEGTPPVVPRARERAKGSIRGGDFISLTGWAETGCTAGYGAWENSEQASNGAFVHRLFLLDVAHCFFPYDTVERQNHPPDESGTQERRPIGTTRRFGYAGLGWGEAINGFTTDAAAIRVQDPWFAPREIYGEDIVFDVKRAVQSPPVGTRVCFSGQRIDKAPCGPIANKPEWTVFKFPPPGFIDTPNQKLLMVCFKAGSRVGDSGGPVWIEGTGNAVGLVTAGTKFTKPKPETCYTPLKPIPGYPGAPGALRAPGMGNLTLMTR